MFSMITTILSRCYFQRQWFMRNQCLFIYWFQTISLSNNNYRKDHIKIKKKKDKTHVNIVSMKMLELNCWYEFVNSARISYSKKDSERVSIYLSILNLKI